MHRTRDIQKVLVANRGEVAGRILRTCRRMGLATVAVFSDADERGPWLELADEAVRLGPAPAKDSYLQQERILAAAKATGADAVHPGFGFLSENPDFAEACERAGLIFVGPPASAIRAMGLKREAKALVATRGVPLVPGSDGGDQSLATLRAEALRVGLPVMVKPSAGGGGKGMRVVRREAELDDAIASAQREAQGAFGDATLILERFLERPRHVEIQVLADAHGTVLHLGERECSLQRRHQKVIEEAPSPAVSPELRERLGRAAIEAARAVGYVNAGTVEFLLTPGGDFYFSEMNTRLQVEHRVTELVTGLDLVEQQLRVARGERLAFGQGEVRLRGHAVEARLYAEDPSRDFLPVTGTVLDWREPRGGHVLVDAGVATGSEVPVHYDPMLAKVVAWGESRDEAASRLGRALDELTVQGLTTNRDFLRAAVRHPAFMEGALHTGFIEEHLEAARSAAPSAAAVAQAAAAVTLAAFEQRRRDREILPHVTPAFRTNGVAWQAMDLREGTQTVRVEYRVATPDTLELRGEGVAGAWRVHGWAPPALRLETPAGLLREARVVSSGLRWHVHLGGEQVTLTEQPRFPPPADASVKGGFMAPMPGKVVRVLVKPGDEVQPGQVLLVLEAMKMEQATRSPTAGRVREVKVRVGDQVTAGQLLVALEDADA